MKRAATIGAAALVLILVVVLVWTRTNTDGHGRPPRSAEITNHKLRITNSETPGPITHRPSPIASPIASTAREDIRKLHEQLGSFLTLLKDPYRPPLGDNTDITRALTGHNRRGIVALPTNDPSIVNGQLVDRWGTPYWFHPRTPDAIDVLSAGPDKTLFTADDIASENFQRLEKR